VQQADHEDRIKDIEPRPVAPDYPDHTVMRAGPGRAPGPKPPAARYRPSPAEKATFVGTPESLGVV
jgi:hypothetical protein